MGLAPGPCAGPLAGPTVAGFAAFGLARSSLEVDGGDTAAHPPADMPGGLGVEEFLDRGEGKKSLSPTVIRAKISAHRRRFIVFPIWDPRFSDLVLGVTIGLSVALVCHCAAWALHL